MIGSIFRLERSRSLLCICVLIHSCDTPKQRRAADCEAVKGKILGQDMLNKESARPQWMGCVVKLYASDSSMLEFVRYTNFVIIIIIISMLYVSCV